MVSGAPTVEGAQRFKGARERAALEVGVLLCFAGAGGQQ